MGVVLKVWLVLGCFVGKVLESCVDWLVFFVFLVVVVFSVLVVLF